MDTSVSVRSRPQPAARCEKASLFGTARTNEIAHPQMGSTENAYDLKRLAVAMLRDAARLMDSDELAERLDAVSWVWGGEGAFDFKTCCRLAGVDPHDVSPKFWLRLAHRDPLLLALTTEDSQEKTDAVLGRAIARQTITSGQGDLFAIPCEDNYDAARLSRLH